MSATSIEARVGSAAGRCSFRCEEAEPVERADHGVDGPGLGIAYLPCFLVENDLSAGTLKSILPDATADAVDIVALYPSRRLLEPRVRHFIDLLVSQLAA
jgi:LysR substrate binding domain-containing protein